MNGPATDGRRAEGSRSERPAIGEIGNWLARRVARPTAVYGCWLAIRLGLTAHQVTLAALCVVARGRAGDRHGRSRPVRRRGHAGPPGLLARPCRRPGRPLARNGQPGRRLSSIT